MKIDRYEWNKYVTIKVDTTEYVFCVPSIRIKAVPYIGKGQSVVTLIDGSRVSRFTSLKYHIDIELKWTEIGQTNYQTYFNAIKDLVDEATTGTVKQFYPGNGFPGVTTNKIIDIIPDVDDDMFQHFFEGVRNRPMNVKLLSSSLLTVLPTWMNEAETLP